MRRVLFVLVQMVCLACGSEPDDTLNTAFNGIWEGSTTFVFEGYAPQLWTGVLSIAVSGNLASVSGVCPDGTSGIVETRGGGDSAEWQGTLSCPSVSAEECSSIVYTYHSARLDLDGDAVLIQGAGIVSGCGQSFPFTIIFTGYKT
jgi:hypothetical protein